MLRKFEKRLKWIRILYVFLSKPRFAKHVERYYDRRTVRYLEEMEHKLQSGQIHLQQVGKVLVPAG